MGSHEERAVAEPPSAFRSLAAVLSCEQRENRIRNLSW